MGKWTPNFTDDVLHAKISNLVSGSIRRAAVEKEPSITYENFVEDLDTGDSFTASLVDILVKELADRRTRSSATDRRLIAERTIRSLRMLASNTRSFPGRLGRPQARRLPEYFTASPNELDVDEDEDEYEVAMENPTTIEGARINSDLYEAFAPAGWGPATTRRATESPPVSDEWPLPPLLRSPSSTNRPWTTTHAATSTSSTPNLARQPSIRRQRSRMVDFHEYAHRRRSNVRDSLNGSRSDAAETVTEPRDGSSAATVRPRRPASMVNPTWSELSDTQSPDSDEPPSAQYYIEPAGSGKSATRTSIAPGGIRAPVSVLSRHASPVPITTSPFPMPSLITFTPEPEAKTSTPANDEPVAYPTPGSTENENVA
ncbi:hypothetical protein BJ912DRAFT_938994 [Pholiota molesta]|nr:hypothetical protein BJ912DRAFT_938994 [Pholiota molesta]